MRLHLLLLSGEATSAGTVAKKGEKDNTTETHEPIWLGKQTLSATEVTQSKWEKLQYRRHYEAVTSHKVLD